METPQRPYHNEDYTSETPTPTRDHSTLLREQEAERERLRITNFNQALRINFLEEQLLRLKQGTDFGTEELEMELVQLRMTVEEREQELRQRNYSMVRATEAMDMLSLQLSEAQMAAKQAKAQVKKQVQAQMDEYIEKKSHGMAKLTEKWQNEVDQARKREQEAQEVVRQLEAQIDGQNERMTMLTEQLEATMNEVQTREERQGRLDRQKEQQKRQDFDMETTKVMAEVQHWKDVKTQMDEQVTALQLQIETMQQEKQTVEAQYQVKVKSMEEQLQHQMQQLQRESEHYRTEHTRLLTDREKVHVEKERVAMENKNMIQERMRLQAEIERMSKERQQIASETENLRLQHVKLTAVSEEQTKSIDSLKTDREVALSTIHQLESQLHQMRKIENEHELVIKTLENRLKHAAVTEESRRAIMNESIKQERARLQAEIERVTKDRQQVVGEAERLRLENVKLMTSCKELTKLLDGLKADRESAVRINYELESELQRRCKLESDHEMTIKTLQSQLEHAEAEAYKLKEECELAQSRCQQISNERLLALEKDRQSMEEDNWRLRKELSGFQMQLEVMEHKLQDSEERLSHEAANAQEQYHRLSVYQVDLERQSVELQEHQKQLAECEGELARRARRVQDLERQLAEAGLAGSSINTAAREQLRKWQSQYGAEKSKLLRQLSEERRRANEMERAAAGLKKENNSTQQELKAVEMELCLHLSNGSMVYSDRRHQTVVDLVREVICALKNNFKTEAAAMQTRWKQQMCMMNSKLERLATQLHSSQSKLEALRSSSARAENAKQSSEKTWSIRYEDFCMRKEEERRSLEEENRYFQAEMTKAEEALARANREIQSLKQSSREKAQYDVHGLKESNRLLFEEVQERRKAAERARKQYIQAVQENKELLKAVAMYKDAIASRDKDIETYQSNLMKHTKQLQRGVDFGEVKQTLLGQLEQTQYMITETYKRWEGSPIGRGPANGTSCREGEYDEAATSQLDEYIGRMHVVSERWGDFLTQSQELHRRYGNAWKLALRGLDRTKDQPRWVDDVDRKCSRLLTEAVHISEAMRDVVNNIAAVVQKKRNEKEHNEKKHNEKKHSEKKHNEKKRNEKEQGKKEGVVTVDNNALMKQRGSKSSAWSPRDSDFLNGKLESQRVSQPHFESPTKQDEFDAPCCNSKASISARRSVKTLYGSSLSSLLRVGMMVQDLETDIRHAYD